MAAVWVLVGLGSVVLVGCGEEPAPRVGSCGSPGRSADEDARQITRSDEYPLELDLEGFGGPLPVAVIDTSGLPVVDEPKIDAVLTIFDSLDEPSAQTVDIGVELRGNFFSILFPKKQLGLEVLDADGDTLDVSFWGMPSDDDWVLSATPGDRTMLRNYVAYAIAHLMGLTAPEMTFVEVFLDQSGGPLEAGDYLGIYAFTEHVTKHKARMGIDVDAGGFLVELTTPDVVWPDEPFVCAPWVELPMIVHYPKAAATDPAALEPIAATLYAFEEALFEGDEHDLSAIVDVEGAVDYWLLHEALLNEDSFVRSVFVTSPTGAELVFGPAWDFDCSMRIETTRPIIANNYSEYGWGAGFLRHSFFVERLVARWHQLREQQLTDDAMVSLVEGAWAGIADAVERTDTKWKLAALAGKEGVTVEEEKDLLVTWLLERFAWLDEHIDEVAASVD